MEENNFLGIECKVDRYRKKLYNIALGWFVVICNFIALLCLYGFTLMCIIKGLQKIWEVKDFFIYLADEASSLAIWSFGFLSIAFIIVVYLVRWIFKSLIATALSNLHKAFMFYKYVITVRDKTNPDISISPVIIESYHDLNDEDVIHRAYQKIIPKIMDATISQSKSKINFK